jgi:hypothetical protein
MMQRSKCEKIALLSVQPPKQIEVQKLALIKLLLGKKNLEAGNLDFRKLAALPEPNRQIGGTVTIGLTACNGPVVSSIMGL